MCKKSGILNLNSVPTYRTRTITKKAYRTNVQYFLAKIKAYRTNVPYHTAILGHQSVDLDSRLVLSHYLSRLLDYLVERLAKTSKIGIHGFPTQHFGPRCKPLGAIALQFLHSYSQSCLSQEAAK